MIYNTLFISLHPIKVVHFLVTKLVKFLMIIYTETNKYKVFDKTETNNDAFFDKTEMNLNQQTFCPVSVPI